jgi:hypothetical protein
MSLCEGRRVLLINGDYSGNYGVVFKAEEHGYCYIVRLDSGLSLLTMGYCVAPVILN